MMRGVYDYKGECFGYIEGDKLYDLVGKHSGFVTPTAINDLQGNLVWHRDEDGLYDRHWVSIGYIGSKDQQNNG